MSDNGTEHASLSYREPPAKLYVTYCPVCGRNDLSMPLKARHSSGGKLCRGVLRQASYARENLDV